jgi:outer membrane protein OmpA-like peptidoglycan-associated protein
MKRLFIVLIFIGFSHTILSQNDTISLYYDIGKYHLNIENSTKITDYLKTINNHTKYSVKVISSADYLGSKESNFSLSKHRAEVINDLLKKDEKYKLLSIETINIGEIESKNIDLTSKNGVLKHRRTLIVFKKITSQKPKIKGEFNDLKVGKKFILENLIFKVGTDKLLHNSIPTLLNKVVRFLKENPNVEIEIGGHVCCGAGKKVLDSTKIIKIKDTYELSVKRARFVYKYLILKRIKSKRLTYAGYGFQLPIHYPEKTTNDMRENKRVEITITKM